MMGLLMIALLGFAFGAFGAVVEVDVAAWTKIGTGTTPDGWTVAGIEAYKDGGAKFSSADDFVLSPCFADSVTQIVMAVKSSSSDVVKKLLIDPVKPDYEPSSAAPTETSDKYSTQVFSWSAEAGLQQFRITESSGASGAWGVFSLTVYTDGIVPPQCLRELSLYRDAIEADWNRADKAVRYEVRYASVNRAPPRFDDVVSWDFSSMTNSHGGNPRTFAQLTGENRQILDGLQGTNVCMEAYASGHIQIGQSEKLGQLAFPMSSVVGGCGELTGVLCAWKHPSDARNPTMPVFSVVGGETNGLVSLELTTEKAEYCFPIPTNMVGECIILSSTTNGIAYKESHGRVRVASFGIVSDYVSGTVTTNEFATMTTEMTSVTFRGLKPGEWVWAVRAVDDAGCASEWSPFRCVLLDDALPTFLVPGTIISIW